VELPQSGDTLRGAGDAAAPHRAIPGTRSIPHAARSIIQMPNGLVISRFLAINRTRRRSSNISPNSGTLPYLFHTM
jgi:hypothetical protein